MSLENGFTNGTRIEDYLTSQVSVGDGNALTKREYDWFFRETFINSSALLGLFSNPIFTNHSNDKVSCANNLKSYIETFDIDERNEVLDRMASSLCDMSDAQILELVEILHKYLGKFLDETTS